MTMTSLLLRTRQTLAYAALASHLFLSASASLQAQVAEWQSGKLKDADQVIYNAKLSTVGKKSLLTLEFNSSSFQSDKPVQIEIQSKEKTPHVRIVDERGKQVSIENETGGSFVEKEAGEVFYQAIQHTTLKVTPTDKPIRTAVIEVPKATPIEAIRIFYTPKEKPATVFPKTNLAPAIAPKPKHQPAERAPLAGEMKDGFYLENRSIKAEFSTTDGLRLRSLRSEYAGKNVLTDPAQTHLFLIEIDGQRFGAEQWEVKKTALLSENEVAVELWLPSFQLAASLTASIDAQGLKLGLSIENKGSNERTWKTAFPQLGGMALSSDADKDYYLFPLRGGLIQTTNANLRTNYGANIAWWQMMALFSPELGTSLSMRCLDETGTYKGIALRKGKTASEAATMTQDISIETLAKSHHWEQSLPGGDGTAFAFEYVNSTRSPGKEITYPQAVVEAYAGDWRPAMRTYADWAHKVWEWRPLKSRLNTAWQIQVINNNLVGGGYIPDLFADGKWYNGYADNGFEISEFGSWWEWQRKGPFGTSLANAEKEIGLRFFKRYTLDRREPVTGELAHPGGGRGDYSEPVSWGGWPAMRASIDAAHKAGKLIALYTSPMLVGDNSEIGAKHGKEYAVINPYRAELPKDVLPTAPRGGYVVHHMAWRFCIGLEVYQDFVAKQMADIITHTGADIIRLDEVGHTGLACFNPDHHHMFGEPGHHTWMRSMQSMTRKVREAVTQAKPEAMIMAEYPGSDFLSAQLDGALTYEANTWSYPSLRVVPLNIFRFYFPEIHLYELRPSAPKATYPHGMELAFWNGVGIFSGKPHPPVHLRILKENSDAFRSRDVEPLVPTLVPRLYANRFAAQGKEITLLFNDKETDVSGKVLQTVNDPTYHYFDLIHGRELDTEGGSVSLTVKPKEVAAVAHLPRVMEIKTTNGQRVLHLNSEVADAAVALCDAEGKTLERGTVDQAAALLAKYPAGPSTYLKLFSGEFLVDAIHNQ